MLLKGRIHDHLFGNGVPSQLPHELVLPSDLVVVALRCLDVVVILLELAVVVLDTVGYASWCTSTSGKGRSAGAPVGVGGLLAYVRGEKRPTDGVGEGLSGWLGEDCGNA